MIYFLQNEDERLIEIGETSRINTRLDRRRGGATSPLRVLAILDGGIAEATAIRGRFAYLQCHGNWHRIDMTLMAYIRAEGRPWEGHTPAGTPAYRDRLTDLATRSRIPAEALAERALSEWAARNGLSDDAVIDGESAVLPAPAPSSAIAGPAPGPGALSAGRVFSNSLPTNDHVRRP